MTRRAGYARCMTKNRILPPPAADEIPATAAAIAGAFDRFQRVSGSPGFAARRAALFARLAADEEIDEGARAAALKLAWGDYSLVRGCGLALVTEGEVHIDSDAGAPALWILRDGGEYRFLNNVESLICALPTAAIDRLAVELVVAIPALAAAAAPSESAEAILQ
jgi:hypothetical protein